jgi:hypothetical protein
VKNLKIGSFHDKGKLYFHCIYSFISEMSNDDNNENRKKIIQKGIRKNYLSMFLE